MMSISPIDLENAYIAGIVDGEGSIYITSGANGRLRVRVKVTNTCEELIQYVCKRWSYNYNTYTPRLVKDGCIRSVIYTCQIEGDAACKWLEVSWPYLMVRKVQAKLVYDFWNNRYGMSKEQANEVERMLHNLNSKTGDPQWRV